VEVLMLMARGIKREQVRADRYTREEVPHMEEEHTMV
jgi:hypothetical protein